jgi:class III poly(R)-hydroxyalkanoic acid synthase PhaE subunit
MEGPRERPAPEPTMSAFAAGVERWATLMQRLARTPPGSPEFQQALLSLQSDFAAQLDAWLRTSHPFTGLQFSPLMPPFGSTGVAAAGRAHGPDAARMASLLNQWVHLQSQLAGHWSTVGRAAAEKFGMQLGKLTGGGPFTDLRKLYDLWIDCAEEAYAETAHSEAFARSVADLINTAVSLQLEGRQHLEQWARAAGLPTREEVDALRERIEQLEQLGRRPSRRKTSRNRRTKRKRQP